MSNVLYASIVGSILQVMACAHPYISHVVSMVNMFIENPNEGYWEAMKWLLHYLRGTTDIGLVYDRGSSTRNSIEGFVNLVTLVI